MFTALADLSNQLPAPYELPLHMEVQTLIHDKADSSLRLSIDIKIIAYLFLTFGLMFGIVGLMWLVGDNTSAGESLPPIRTFFGLISIEDAPLMGIYSLVNGTITIISGVCLLKLNSVGWYLALLLLADGVVSNWLSIPSDRSPDYLYMFVISSVLSLLMAAILIVRRRQFGGRNGVGEETGGI